MPPQVAAVPITGQSWQRSLFDDLPALVYAQDPMWAPASATIATQVFGEAAAGSVALHPVVVLRAGRPLARAAGIISGGGAAPQGWIGLIECVPGEPGAGRLAIEDCQRWLAGQGCAQVLAPRATMLMSGLLVAGFDHPQVILTPHNPPWYAQLLQACGFRAKESMVAFEFTRERVPHFPRSAPGVRVRHVDIGALPAELQRIRLFQQEIFAGSPGHQDRTAGQMQGLVTNLGVGLDPELALIAEDHAGTTIGVLICLADTWQRHPPGGGPDRARLLTIGVAPGWRRRGVAVAMTRTLADTLLRKGYQTMEASWVLGDNLPPQVLARALGARATRRFALLTWHTDAGG